MLYVTIQIYVGRSPVGEVILVSRAPIHRNGLISSRADSTPVCVEDIVRLTGEVLEEEEENDTNKKGLDMLYLKCILCIDLYV